MIRERDTVSHKENDRGGMGGHDNIVKVIFCALDEVNEQLPEDVRLKKTRDTLLFGKSGPLDSLALVNLIVAVENKMKEVLGISITMTEIDDISIFETVKTLSEYIAGVVRSGK